MADWPLVADNSLAALALPSADLALTRGARLVQSTANTKGNWTELLTATAFDTRWLHFEPVSCNALTDYLVDIGIGASGSEQVIIPNITVSMRSGAIDSGGFLVPIAIPAGTRIAARVQSFPSGGDENRVLVHVYGGGFKQSSPGGVVDTYGANTADSGGVSVDPGGSAHTKGAWSEITSATLRDIGWAVVGFGNQINTARTQCVWLVDLGVGASGSEQVIVPNMLLKSGATGPSLTPTALPLPVKIPGGSRVAMRAQCSITDATDRTFDGFLYGVNC